MDGTAMNLTDKIDRFFKISERGSSIKTEILAGATTFMTMVFLVAVHPAIMAGAGMDKGAMATVTLLTAAILRHYAGFTVIYPLLWPLPWEPTDCLHFPLLPPAPLPGRPHWESISYPV